MGILYFYNIHIMEKRSTLKQPMLRKMHTMAETKRQQWSLPPQYLKVLLLLSITRKVIRVTGKKIKDSQDKQNSQLQFLKKTYSGSSCNSFDFIAPIKRKFIQLKITKQMFSDLKKDMLQFLKNVRSQVKRGTILRKADTAGQFNFSLRSTNPLGRQCKQDNSLLVCSPNVIGYAQSTPRKQPIFSKSQQLQTNKFQQVIFYQTQQNMTKTYCMNRTRKLKKKIQSQSVIFKRFNHTLSKFYMVKGSLQLFQFYLSSLYEVKNCIGVHFFEIFSQKQQCKQRIFYEIKQMGEINNIVLSYCKIISQANQIIKTKIQQSIQKYQQLAQNEFNVNQKSQDQNLSQFIKKSCIMIQVIKGILVIPTISQILIDKTKLFTQLFEKLSQFRYFARYLRIQIANMNKKTKVISEDDEMTEYVAKWRKVFDRKFKPLKINAKQI